ncbi:MAG: c-type cytochrome, partial [Planctomycetia bacterium]
MNASQYAMNVAGTESGIGRRAAGLALAVLLAWAGGGGTRAGGSDEGYELLRSKAYLPADFDQEVFDALWTTWPQPLRSRAEQASVEERRRMARERYGLDPDPADPSRSLQYVRGADGAWTMSCLACHQGQVAGRAIPGVPNSTYALETLTEEVRLVKVRQRKPFGHMDMGSLLLPLGTTNGTTNAVIFGVALLRHRDADLNIVKRPPKLDLVHHDMDAPAWWHYRRRTGLYADGFAPKGHRMLMQFLLVKENGPEKFAAWEDDFRAIQAWLESLEPPRWPWAIDAALAEQGRAVFESHCASCHGTYGPGGSYPERMVAIDEIGTDRVRFDSLTLAQRRDLNASWFGHHGGDVERLRNREPTTGYVAPPLDGVWASAPYFHNG